MLEVARGGRAQLSAQHVPEASATILRRRLAQRSAPGKFSDQLGNPIRLRVESDVAGEYVHLRVGHLAPQTRAAVTEWLSCLSSCCDLDEYQ